MKAIIILLLICLGLPSCYTTLYLLGLEEKNERKAEAEINARLPAWPTPTPAAP